MRDRLLASTTSTAAAPASLCGTNSDRGSSPELFVDDADSSDDAIAQALGSNSAATFSSMAEGPSGTNNSPGWAAAALGRSLAESDSAAAATAAKSDAARRAAALARMQDSASHTAQVAEVFARCRALQQQLEDAQSALAAKAVVGVQDGDAEEEEVVKTDKTMMAATATMSSTALVVKSSSTLATEYTQQSATTMTTITAAAAAATADMHPASTQLADRDAVWRDALMHWHASTLGDKVMASAKGQHVSGAANNTPTSTKKSMAEASEAEVESSVRQLAVAWESALERRLAAAVMPAVEAAKKRAAEAEVSKPTVSARLFPSHNSPAHPPTPQQSAQRAVAEAAAERVAVNERARTMARELQDFLRQRADEHAQEVAALQEELEATCMAREDVRQAAPPAVLRSVATQASDGGVVAAVAEALVAARAQWEAVAAAREAAVQREAAEQATAAVRDSVAIEVAAAKAEVAAAARKQHAEELQVGVWAYDSCTFTARSHAVFPPLSNNTLRGAARLLRLWLLQSHCRSSRQLRTPRQPCATCAVPCTGEWLARQPSMGWRVQRRTRPRTCRAWRQLLRRCATSC